MNWTMRLTIFAFCCLFSWQVDAQLHREKFVDTYEELILAINEANRWSPEVPHRLNVGEIAVPSGPPLPAITGRITIRDGQFTRAGQGPFTLFTVAPEGILSVSYTGFSGWSNGSPLDVLLFDNHGDLQLEEVRFAVELYPSPCGSESCFGRGSSLLRNRETGRLTARRSYFFDTSELASPLSQGEAILTNEGTARFERVQFLLGPSRGFEPLVNRGTLEIVNSSFLKRAPRELPPLSLLSAGDSARTLTADSVFDGMAGSDCALLQSEGHNTHSSADCDWAATGDQTGVEPSLIWRQHGYNSPHLVPSATSPLLDSADPDRCDLGYGAEDADGDGQEECDRGAVELVPSSLTEGSINGLYFNPQEDGHFVTALQTGDATLLVWNTFDADGRPAWIYGLGKLSRGRSLVAEAYINRSRGLSPEGLMGDVEAEYWGRLELDMTTCKHGNLLYRSLLPEFGTGQFEIERLSVVRPLGCGDQTRTPDP